MIAARHRVAHGSRADRCGSLLTVLLLLASLLSLGLTFLSRTGGERRLTERLLSAARAQAIGDAAAAEVTWTVRKGMNRPGDVWFDAMRRSLPASESVQSYTPKRAQRLLEELTGMAAPAVRVGVKVTLRDARELRGPAPDTIEKSGYLECETVVTIGAVDRKQSELREFRVVRTAPAAPMDAFTLWLFSGPGAGAIRAPAKFPSTPLAPLPASELGVIDSGWKYEWGGSRNRFPFSRDRVSEVHADWDSFLARNRRPSGTIRLDGLNVVTQSSDVTLAGGRIEGPGALCLPDAGLLLSGVALDGTEVPQIAVLGPGKRLELAGYSAGSRIRAALAVPDGTLVTEAGLALEGSVCAGQWQPAAGNTLTFLSAPCPYSATLSEVVYVR